MKTRGHPGLFHPSNIFIFTYCDKLASNSNCNFLFFLYKKEFKFISSGSIHVSRFQSHLPGTIYICESIFCPCGFCGNIMKNFLAFIPRVAVIITKRHKCNALYFATSLLWAPHDCKDDNIMSSVDDQTVNKSSSYTYVYTRRFLAIHGIWNIF